ncbi:MAG TPA: xanthine dehydrogenase family protein molybdopterin-binding subunit [Ilumatobacter sp.]|nr:xanthine dehydrogenase family protein molybdopterin-binding subunit [Ilumatobacter sp.]
MAGSVLGEKVLRKEDPKFLTTGGVYMDDFSDARLDGAGWVVFARSPVAHGTIVSIDADDAKAFPGVVGVYTAADLELTPTPSGFNPAVARTLLASDKVRWVGEPVVAVVADTYTQAVDAAEAVLIDIDPLPALTTVQQAMASDTLIYEAAGSNVVFDSNFLGGSDNTGPEWFEGCEVVVSETVLNQRVAPCPLEPRAGAAAWVRDGDAERLLVWVSSQHVQGAKDGIAGAAGVPAEQVRVMTPDVGGGFGAKIGVYSEELLLGVLARAAGRPVRFRETRSESMMNLGHGRSQLQHITVGGTRDGKVTHLRLELTQDSGGFCEIGTILGSLFTRGMASAVYDIPNIETHCYSVVTNTNAVVAYRGAGRPEATAAAERAMDLFAKETGLDPVEVRRKNLIPKFTEPHSTQSGQTYDVGDYEASLDKALEAADYAALRAEQAARRESGDVKQLGIGVSVYVEITGGVPPMNENAKIVVHPDGTGTIYTGTSPHGQGHDTAWSSIASAQTGISIEDFTLVWGDTDLTPIGTGTMGSRSLQQGGVAVHHAAVGLVDKAKQLAARLLEADVADVVLDVATGAFHVAGTPAVAKTWADLGAAADPDELTEEHLFQAAMPTYPFGSHVAVVEVDTETGEVRHIRHVACDDAGTIVNPMLVNGQVHGGIAQGAAQALWEEVRYDADGNPITSNFADYGIITADLLPHIERIPMETPTFVNPLGAKGIGESGTIGSTPAIHSAVMDALAPYGVQHIDMPCTPQKVWAAIQSSQN